MTVASEFGSTTHPTSSDNSPLPKRRRIHPLPADESETPAAAVLTSTEALPGTMTTEPTIHTAHSSGSQRLQSPFTTLTASRSPSVRVHLVWYPIPSKVTERDNAHLQGGSYGTLVLGIWSVQETVNKSFLSPIFCLTVSCLLIRRRTMPCFCVSAL